MLQQVAEVGSVASVTPYPPTGTTDPIDSVPFPTGCKIATALTAQSIRSVSSVPIVLYIGVVMTPKSNLPTWLFRR